MSLTICCLSVRFLVSKKKTPIGISTDIMPDLLYDDTTKNRYAINIHCNTKYRLGMVIYPFSKKILAMNKCTPISPNLYKKIR